MSIITNELLGVCEKKSGNTAFVFLHDREIVKKSYSELLADIKSKTAYLLLNNVRSGDKILAFAKESYDLAVFMIAAMNIGASIMYIDIWAKEERLRLGYEKFKPDYIVVSRKTAKLKFFFSGINKINKTLYVEGMASADGVALSSPDDTATALITMTTGSTGEPKAAIRTHAHLYEQLKLIKNNMKSERDEVVLTTSFMYVFANILNGFTTVLGDFNLSRDSEKRLMEKLERFSDVPVSMIFTTPDFCMKTHGVFPSLREVFIGGAILNLYEARTIRDNYKDAKITYIYGATECNLITRTTLDEYIDTLVSFRVSSLGSAVSGVEIMCDGENRIAVTSGALLENYLGGELPKNKMRDNDGRLWHFTGDAGRISDGKLCYLGRNDMRLPLESAVYSNEVEQALCVGFPTLKKCAMVSKNSELHLFLEGENIDRAALKGFLSESFAIDDVTLHFLKKIPCDVKHHTKIDYKKLMTLIK